MLHRPAAPRFPVCPLAHVTCVAAIGHQGFIESPGAAAEHLHRDRNTRQAAGKRLWPYIHVDRIGGRFDAHLDGTQLFPQVQRIQAGGAAEGIGHDDHIAPWPCRRSGGNGCRCSIRRARRMPERLALGQRQRHPCSHGVQHRKHLRCRVGRAFELCLECLQLGEIRLGRTPLDPSAVADGIDTFPAPDQARKFEAPLRGAAAVAAHIQHHHRRVLQRAGLAAKGLQQLGQFLEIAFGGIGIEAAGGDPVATAVHPAHAIGWPEAATGIGQAWCECRCVDGLPHQRIVHFSPLHEEGAHARRGNEGIALIQQHLAACMDTAGLQVPAPAEITHALPRQQLRVNAIA